MHYSSINLNAEKLSNILVLHTNYPTKSMGTTRSGIDNSIELLVQGLREKGHSLTVIRGGAPRSNPTHMDGGGVKVIGLPIRRPYWPYDNEKHSKLSRLYWHYVDDAGREPMALSKYIFQLRPDLVILADVTGLGHKIIELCQRLSIPTLQILQDFYYICPDQKSHGCKTQLSSGHCVKCKYLTTQRRSALDGADRVVAVSEFIQKMYQQKDVFGVEVVRGGIKDITEGPLRRDGLLKLGYLGRLLPEKGIEILIDAMQSFEDKAELHIAGTGASAYVAQLRKSAPRNVIFSGYVESTADFLHSIDVLAAPFLYDEPFGRISLEAQMAGRAVIVSNKGGLPETVREGKTGLVIEPDLAGLHEAISQLVEHPDMRIAMSTSARTHAKQFSRDKMVDEINKHIKDLT